MFRVTENCTLTAKWTVNRYAIAYDLNGGFLSGVQNLTTQVYNYGTTIRLTSVIPSRTGYTFVGWGLSADATVVYPSGAAVMNLTPQANEVITFYAIWSLDPADVPVPSVPTFPGYGELNSAATVSTYAARSTTTGVTKTYAYDLTGNRTRFVLTKDGAAVHNVVYQYDVLNRLAKVYQNNTLCATYEYDVNGNRTKLSYPVTQTDTTYTYNKANWVTGMTSVDNGTTLVDYSYTYYASGNQKSVTDKDGIVTAYTYDHLGRLTKESETGGLTIQYTYSAAGNRTKMVVTGTEAYTTTYTYDANNRLTQESKKVGSTTTTTVYTYDFNGNLTQKSNPSGAEQYEYNGFNQLVQLRQGSEVATYTYNAAGIRTSKQVGNLVTCFLLDGGDVVAEFTNGTPTARYLRGINLISRTTTSGTAYYLHNAHGDTVALTDSTGAVTKRYDYDAFGNEENPDSSDANPFRYCGEYFDKETGTYYLRARYYDPAIGRFTQQDSLLFTTRKLASGYEYADPLSLNLYAYCYNNPVAYLDPSGHQGLTVQEAFSRKTNPMELAGLTTAIGGVCAVGIGIVLGETAYIFARDSGRILDEAAIERAQIETINDQDLHNYTVYIIMDQENKVVYVGMTSKYSKREYQHTKRPNAVYPYDRFTMSPVETGLSETAAHIREQTLIVAFILKALGEMGIEMLLSTSIKNIPGRGINNKYNSIAPAKWGSNIDEFERISTLLYCMVDGDS